MPINYNLKTLTTIGSEKTLIHHTNYNDMYAYMTFI